jgi:hypothetical protein
MLLGVSGHVTLSCNQWRNTAFHLYVVFMQFLTSRDLKPLVIQKPNSNKVFLFLSYLYNDWNFQRMAS